MSRSYLILFVFLFTTPFVFSQRTISGSLTDAESGEALIGAHLFLTGTQLGTVTDANGFFELKEVPKGAAELNAQYVGYESWSRKLFVLGKPLAEINIKLNPLLQRLGTVDVTAKASNKRKRYINRFTKSFIGSSSLAKKCTLLNPEVLLFENKGNILTAQASNLLKIENRGTGYLIYFLLEKFELKGPEVIYAGKPMFQPLQPNDEIEKENWEKAREKAYLGSRAHFFNSLANGKLEQQGYEIRAGDMNDRSQFVSSGLALPKRIMSEGVSDYDRILTLNNFLQIVYKNEKGKPHSVNTRGISLGRDHETNQSNLGGRENNKYQISYLYALHPRVQFFTNGRVDKPYLLKEYGHFGTERVAELIPSDFSSEATPAHQPKNTLNGFDLDNLSIELKEIKKGGPPRDGIPSIDKPVFIAPEFADFLNPNDLILGVNYNSKSKAYPIRILDWHEIVNDYFGEIKVAVTYCPLCGSGMAFNTENIGVLGVSGLLYNSDVLLYDRATESLWSQIMGEAISGEKIGNKLEYISTTLTTWKKWQEQHPNALVLSENTGYKKDYSKSPYGGYEGSERLIFSVSQKNSVLKNKERILGIEINGKFKAYPYLVLNNKNNISDQFNGKDVSINFDKKSRYAEVKVNGENYPSVSMFWFAWYAFHPETEVFK